MILNGLNWFDSSVSTKLFFPLFFLFSFFSYFLSSKYIATYRLTHRCHTGSSSSSSSFCFFLSITELHLFSSISSSTTAKFQATPIFYGNQPLRSIFLFRFFLQRTPNSSYFLLRFPSSPNSKHAVFFPANRPTLIAATLPLLASLQ